MSVSVFLLSAQQYRNFYYFWLLYRFPAAKPVGKPCGGKIVLGNNEKYIVIRDVIRKKNPALLRWMPRFVLRYVERVVHEDDINRVMDNIGHLHGLEFVDALIGELGVIVELTGEEHIPLTGGVIFASNH